MPDQLRIIDADSHFDEPLDWLAEVDPSLAGELSMNLHLRPAFDDAVFGPVLKGLPRNLRRRRGVQLEPAYALLTSAPDGQGARSTRVASRLAHLDAEGIDVQFIHPGLANRLIRGVERNRPDCFQRIIRAYNTWTSVELQGSTDRLRPTTLIDLNDVDWSVGELEAGHSNGSRSFLLPAEPVGGRSLSHYDLDIIWETATNLGMLAVMHVGSGRINLDAGWGNTGRENLGDVGFLALSQLWQAPMISLTAMIAGGVFERYPALTVVVQEFGVHWASMWLESLDRICQSHVLVSRVGRWPWPLGPGEYATRNVRLCPLPGDNVPSVVDRFDPPMIVFGSDYPHPEGSVTAARDLVAVFLDMGVAEPVQRAFFGDLLAEFAY